MTNQIPIPDMCMTHKTLLVRQCDYGPNDAWIALLIATQAALFQGATADPKVRAETRGNLKNMMSIGCLACRKPDLFGTVIDMVQKSPRTRHISAIKALGERWVAEAVR